MQNPHHSNNQSSPVRLAPPCTPSSTERGSPIVTRQRLSESMDFTPPHSSPNRLLRSDSGPPGANQIKSPRTCRASPATSPFLSTRCAHKSSSGYRTRKKHRSGHVIETTPSKHSPLGTDNRQLDCLRTAFRDAIHSNPPPIPPRLISPNGSVVGTGRSNCSSSQIEVLLRLLPSDSIPNPSTTSTSLTVDRTHKQVTLTNVEQGQVNPKLYTFDEIFTETNSLLELCTRALTDLIQSVVAGSDACLICLGSSGISSHPLFSPSPTHTSSQNHPLIHNAMTGVHDDTHGSSNSNSNTNNDGNDTDTPNGQLGLIPCAITWLFRLIGDQKERHTARFSVRVSAIQLGLTPRSTGGMEEDSSRDLLANCALSHSTENQTELRATSAERAAHYLDVALAASHSLCGTTVCPSGVINDGVDDTTTGERMGPVSGEQSRLFQFTLHVYQYRVEHGGIESGVSGGHSRLHMIYLSHQAKSTRPTRDSPSRSSSDDLGSITTAFFSALNNEPRHSSSAHRHGNSKLNRLLTEALGNGDCLARLVVETTDHAMLYEENLQLLQFCSNIQRLRRHRLATLSSTTQPLPLLPITGLMSSEDGSSCDSFTRRRASRHQLQRTEGNRSHTSGRRPRKSSLYKLVPVNHRLRNLAWNMAQSSERDYTSSSEQSCDTVIYLGRHRRSPTKDVGQSVSEEKKSKDEEEADVVSRIPDIGGQFIPTTSNLLSFRANQDHQPPSISETEHTLPRQNVRSTDVKRPPLSRANAYAWPRAAVKNAIETLSTQKEQWVDGPKASYSPKRSMTSPSSITAQANSSKRPVIADKISVAPRFGTSTSTNPIQRDGQANEMTDALAPVQSNTGDWGLFRDGQVNSGREAERAVRDRLQSLSNQKLELEHGQKQITTTPTSNLQNPFPRLELDQSKTTHLTSTTQGHLPCTMEEQTSIRVKPFVSDWVNRHSWAMAHRSLQLNPMAAMPQCHCTPCTMLVKPLCYENQVDLPTNMSATRNLQHNAACQLTPIINAEAGLNRGSLESGTAQQCLLDKSNSLAPARSSSAQHTQTSDSTTPGIDPPNSNFARIAQWVNSVSTEAQPCCPTTANHSIPVCSSASFATACETCSSERVPEWVRGHPLLPQVSAMCSTNTPISSRTTNSFPYSTKFDEHTGTQMIICCPPSSGYDLSHTDEAVRTRRGQSMPPASFCPVTQITPDLAPGAMRRTSRLEATSLQSPSTHMDVCGHLSDETYQGPRTHGRPDGSSNPHLHEESLEYHMKHMAINSLQSKIEACPWQMSQIPCNSTEAHYYKPSIPPSCKFPELVDMRPSAWVRPRQVQRGSRPRRPHSYCSSVESFHGVELDVPASMKQVSCEDPVRKSTPQSGGTKGAKEKPLKSRLSFLTSPLFGKRKQTSTERESKPSKGSNVQTTNPKPTVAHQTERNSTWTKVMSKPTPFEPHTRLESSSSFHVGSSCQMTECGPIQTRIPDRYRYDDSQTKTGYLRQNKSDQKCLVQPISMSVTQTNPHVSLFGMPQASRALPSTQQSSSGHGSECSNGTYLYHNACGSLETAEELTMGEGKLSCLCRNHQQTYQRHPRHDHHHHHYSPQCERQQPASHRYHRHHHHHHHRADMTHLPNQISHPSSSMNNCQSCLLHPQRSQHLVMTHKDSLTHSKVPDDLCQQTSVLFHPEGEDKHNQSGLSPSPLQTTIGSVTTTRRGGGHTSSGYESIILRDSEASSRTDSTSGSSVSNLVEVTSTEQSQHAPSVVTVTSVTEEVPMESSVSSHGGGRTSDAVTSWGTLSVQSCSAKPSGQLSNQIDALSELPTTLSEHTIKLSTGEVGIGSNTASSSSSTSRRSRSVPPMSEDTSGETNSTSPLSVRYMPPRPTVVPQPPISTCCTAPSTALTTSTPVSALVASAIPQVGMNVTKTPLSGVDDDGPPLGQGEFVSSSAVYRDEVQSMMRQIRYEKIYDLLAQQDALKMELMTTKDSLVQDSSSWSFNLSVIEHMDPDEAGFLEALELETAKLSQRVNKCKSHLMFITCFGTMPTVSPEKRE